MKFLAFVMLAASVALVSCEGDKGDLGPQGPAGPQGSAGKNSLTRTVAVPAGTNCANGGIKIESGLDANSNGTLEDNEVAATQTKYVCNAASSNVTQFVLGAHDFSSGDFYAQVSTTADTASKSTWHAYLVNSNGLTYAVPGAGVNGTTTYRHYYETDVANPGHNIDVVTGPGDAYVAIKIIRVYTGDIRNGRVAEPNWNNYEEVRKFYNLPE